MGCWDLVGPFSTYCMWLFLTGGCPWDFMMSIWQNISAKKKNGDLSRCPWITHRLDGHIILSVDRERERLGEWGTHCVRPLMNLDTVQFKLPIRQLGSSAAIVFINYPTITWGDSFASDSRLVYVFGIFNNPSMKERIWNVHQSWINLNRHEKAFKEKNEHNSDNRMLDWITGAKCQHWQKNNKQPNALLFSNWCSVVL